MCSMSEYSFVSNINIICTVWTEPINSIIYSRMTVMYKVQTIASI